MVQGMPLGALLVLWASLVLCEGSVTIFTVPNNNSPDPGRIYSECSKHQYNGLPLPVGYLPNPRHK